MIITTEQPTVVDEGGTKEWLDDNSQRHRTDGPGVIRTKEEKTGGSERPTGFIETSLVRLEDTRRFVTVTTKRLQEV